MTHDLKPDAEPVTRYIVLLIALAVMALLIRLIPSIPNISPLAALAMFSGFLCRKWLYGAALIIMTLALSDLLLGVYDWKIQASVYIGLSWPALLGPLLRRFHGGRLLWASLTAALASSMIFYLLTNFAVWAFGTYYPATREGLLECYTLALPFYRLTLIGDIAWTAVFFGGWVFAAHYRPATQQR
ncbi:MAG: DUF6580 family putative transport protein [bacterium]